MRFSATHPACGTRAHTELPPGYPVHEGVALYCARCGVAWWEEPRTAGDPATAARSDPSPAAAPSAASAPAAPGPEPARPPSAAPARVAPAAVALGSTPTGPGPALRRWVPAALALGAFVVLAVVVALSAVDPDPGAQATEEVVREPTAVATMPPAQPPAATPEPPRRVRHAVAGRSVATTLPRGWTTRRRTRGLTYVGPAGARVRVSVGPRDGRSLRRLGADARRSLGAGRRVALRRARVGGLRAVAVVARGQVIVQVPDGARRWLISRPADAGAAVSRSIRVT